MTLGERIRKLRRTLDLTQQEFASQIGTTANVLSNYETNRRNPSASAFNNICKTYRINEKWLHTGEGEMFLPKPTNIALDDPTLDDMDRQIITSYVNMRPEQRVYIKAWIAKIAAAQSPNSTDRK